MRRFEPILAAFFLATWIVGLLSLFRLIASSGALRISLYPLFSIAAAVGWVSGNAYRVRSRRSPSIYRRGVFVLYFVGPLGFLLLLRSMAPRFEQAAAPLVPLYSWIVFSVLFLVPIVLRRTASKRRRLKIGDRDLKD